ncbi:MAG: endonuclease, partial [Thaumarchaeota archaeon]|nr:endonuclease [Nitrososphaerota archaeon]
MLLGAHVSISGSIDKAVDRARELGCTTFQMFTRNPRGWTAKPLKKKEVEAFREKFREAGFKVAVAHMP